MPRPKPCAACATTRPSLGRVVDLDVIVLHTRQPVHNRVAELVGAQASRMVNAAGVWTLGLSTFLAGGLV